MPNRGTDRRGMRMDQPRVTPGFKDNMNLSQEDYEALQLKLNTYELGLRTIAGYRQAIYDEKTNAQVARDVLAEFGVKT